MLRRRLITFAVALLLIAGVAGGTLLWALWQVPEFYEQALAHQSDPEVRQESAKEFDQRAWRLVAELQHAPAWSEEFRQDDVNSWLAEELHTKYPELVPPGVSQPRVMLREENIQIGFRFDDTRFQGIISLEVRPWVPAANQLAIEVRSVKAGLIPIPLERVIDELSRQLEANGWRIEWTHNGGNDVLVVHLDRGDKDQPVLERIDLAAGSLRISGTRRRKDSSGPLPQPLRLSSMLRTIAQPVGE